MADSQTLRFEDWYRYDVLSDRQVVRLLGITGAGTYSAEFGVSSGVGPHEVEMEDRNEYISQDAV